MNVTTPPTNSHDTLALNQLFPEISDLVSPVESISSLLSYIGNTFQCDRVYIFEKRDADYYDCTYEWFNDQTTFSKKHLMQNLQANAVHHYYHYFYQGKNLVVQNLDDLRQENETLYRLLLPQDLDSLLSGQLLYDSRDTGFIGIDNPSHSKFRELESIFDALKYYITLQLHEIHTKNKLENSSATSVSYPLYTRLSQVVSHEPLALLYCSVSTKFQYSQIGDGLFDKVLFHSENVLSSIFDKKNVFHIDRDEFLVFFDDNEEMDISSIYHYMTLARTTLESMNIILCMGVAITSKYDSNFFELVQMANSKLLRERKKYRDLYIGKYHMDTPSTPYQDLVQIRPLENHYTILFSEYHDPDCMEGSLNTALKKICSRIKPEEQSAFLNFWKVQLASASHIPHDEPGITTHNFSIRAKEGTVRLTLHLASYFDINGNLTFIVYTS